VCADVRFLHFILPEDGLGNIVSLYDPLASVSFLRCTFASNSIYNKFSALLSVYDGSSARLETCEFKDNVVVHDFYRGSALVSDTAQGSFYSDVPRKYYGDNGSQPMLPLSEAPDGLFLTSEDDWFKRIQQVIQIASIACKIVLLIHIRIFE
jgi:hypothetical protein